MMKTKTIVDSDTDEDDVLLEAKEGYNINRGYESPLLHSLEGVLIRDKELREKNEEIYVFQTKSLKTDFIGLIKNKFNSIKESILDNKNKEDNDYMIMPNDNTKIKFDFLIMLFALYNVFFVPIQVAFEPAFLDSLGFTIADAIVDTIFFIDIIICFRTIYIDENGEEHSDLGLIAKKYISSTFIIDLLSIIPFDLLLQKQKASGVGEDENSTWTLMFGILKLGRLLRFNKIV